MDQRKLIHFGKSAYCITLPHTWIKKNCLKKGDILSVQETLRGSLEVIPHIDTLNESSSLQIDIGGKSIDEIIHLLLATYLNGYTIITLQGLNSGKVAYIRKHVHEFIAAEIMEVTADKITIHVFWDIDGISLHSIMNRVSHIIRNIFGETIGMLEGQIDAEDIKERGNEVQRQVLLAKRAITYALTHSTVAQKFNMTALELYYVSYIIYFFGVITEYLVGIAQVMNDAGLHEKLGVKSRTQLKELLQRTSEYFSKVIDNYKKKSENSRFISSEYQNFERAIDIFRKSEKNNPLLLWIPVVSEYVKMIILKIKETEFIMINIENSPKALPSNSR
jgi:phosphate uptake regulator